MRAPLMMAGVAITGLALTLGGCGVARGAWDTVNIFQGKSADDPKVDRQDMAAGDAVKRLPGGLVGDSANAAHTGETLQPENPQ